VVQSGGPLFDAEGKICACKAEPSIYILDFDIEEKAIIRSWQGQKSDMGLCLYPFWRVYSRLGDQGV